MNNLILKTKYLILSLLIFTAFSCSNDDDNDEPAVTIVETWKVSAITSENAYDLNNDSSATNDLLTELGCTFNQSLIFKSDNTGTVELSTAVVVYEGSTAGTFESICGPMPETADDLTWSQTDTSRTYTINGFSYTGIVSGNQLIFIFTDGLPIFDDETGTNLVSSEDVQFTYTLQ